MAGRKPKPTKLKLVQGNPGKRPLNDAEPQPENKAPACPAWLDKISKAKWKSVAPELERIGVLTKIDGAILAAYCKNYSRWVMAERVLTEKGTTYESNTAKGIIVRVRPELKIAEEAMRQMRAFASEFGLTPSSRTRLKGTAGQISMFGGDDDEKFFS